LHFHRARLHPRLLAYFEDAENRLAEIKPRYRTDGALLISKEERLFNHHFTGLPPDCDRIFRWKHETTQEEQEEFENDAGDLLKNLGYEAFSL
jgi:hypothetical protein